MNTLKIQSLKALRAELKAVVSGEKKPLRMHRRPRLNRSKPWRGCCRGPARWQRQSQGAGSENLPDDDRDRHIALDRSYYDGVSWWLDDRR